MLTEDEIFLAIDNVPITQKYVVGVGRAIEATVLAKLAAARMHEQNGGNVQPYVQAGAPGATDAERAAWLADKIGALGDYAKEAAAMLLRWPSAPTDDAWVAQVVSSGPHNFQLLQWRSADISLSTAITQVLKAACTDGVLASDAPRCKQCGVAPASVVQVGWICKDDLARLVQTGEAEIYEERQEFSLLPEQEQFAVYVRKGAHGVAPCLAPSSDDRKGPLFGSIDLAFRLKVFRERHDISWSEDDSALVADLAAAAGVAPTEGEQHGS